MVVRVSAGLDGAVCLFLCVWNLSAGSVVRPQLSCVHCPCMVAFDPAGVVHLSGKGTKCDRLIIHYNGIFQLSGWMFDSRESPWLISFELMI